MKTVTHYSTIEGNSLSYWGLLGALGLVLLLGLGAVYVMEHYGHYVTGMNNHVVWGMPHVFAVFMIIAASGVLNVASIGTVFGRKTYKPLGRLSGLLAFALLAGGLMVLMLDLGRPDRLIIAMTYLNPKSVFAWNILLYPGFFLAVLVYVWFMMERRMNKYSYYAGLFAFIWRLLLTTGTGSIFGFIVARQGYDAAVLAPMFIIMSFGFGLAIYILVLMAACRWTGRELGDHVLRTLKNLLGVFIASIFYFVFVLHLTNLYGTENHGIERFLLMDGGIYTRIFWIGWVVIGMLLPMAIVYHPNMGKSRNWVGIASALVIIGGLASMYVIIIGGQAYPMPVFPGYEVVGSTFYDGQIVQYTPSIWEIGLGVGGVALALAMTVFAIKVLPFLPNSLADNVADPHYKPAEKAEG
jgi:molybdopterin-containing oxidoreductase family membrane subunit